MSTKFRPLAEITQQAIQILYRELGVVDTARFLNQYTSGYGNYTEERRSLFADQTLNEIVAEIKQRRERKP